MSIYRSPCADLDIPAMSVPEFVLSRTDERGDRAALIDGVDGRTIRYGELRDRVARVAGALSSLGVRKGDTCAIYSPNTIEFPIVVLAVARLGGIVTTANPSYTAEELTRQLSDSCTRILFTSPAVGAAAREAAAQANVERVFCFGETPGTTPFETLLSGTIAAPPVAIDPDDLVALPYSSGTTGLPKGVMLSHRNLVANMLQVDASDHLRDGEDTLVCFLPFFHIYGMVVVMLAGLWRGATLVVMPRFDLTQYLDLVERHRATLLHVVPPVMLALAKHPAVEGRDFSSVRKVFSGAAPLGPDVILECTRRMTCVFQQGYGMTEASPATHTSSCDPAMAAHGSVGPPIASTECRLVDVTTGEPANVGCEGEVWVRGPQVMRGYFNQPEATRSTVDEDGWLHTGDIGRVDERGNLYIVDRLKELIKYKGLQIAPAELEGILLAHPAVSDAAVIPVPDAEAGEIPKGLVVLRSPATAEELMAFVAARVAPYKRLRHLAFVDAVPKSPSGKILRRLLRDSERARQAR